MERILDALYMVRKRGKALAAIPGLGTSDILGRGILIVRRHCILTWLDFPTEPDRPGDSKKLNSNNPLQRHCS